ncbi:DUF3800 domain-containing protein [Tunturiibacter gelidiferens]|uniref:DUF3800 domain-containing protein n=1 Tax=Tunturiibacter gelidiferens TaxID=3069689 RepID=A0AAU7YYU9_9BACT
MLYQCFLDDSKDKHQEFAYVCAGFYARKEDWEAFYTAWNNQLKAEGITYFKTSEFKWLTKEFQRFRILPEPYGRQAATLVRERLIDLAMHSKGIRGIGVSIPVSVYNELRELPLASEFFTENIYKFAFESLLFKLSSMLAPHTVAFVHDEGDDFNELHDVYMAFKTANHETVKWLGPFLPLDDKIHAPLQIADILANSVMGKHSDMLKGREVNPLEVEFIQQSEFFTFTKEFGLAVMKVNYQERGIPLPDYLESIVVP